MKKFILLIPFILSGCTLFGPTYTGETTADDLLKYDTASNITLFSEQSIIARLNKFTPRLMM